MLALYVGRRKLYLISFSIAVLGTICCAESVNVAMFIVFRGVSAAGSSSVSITYLFDLIKEKYMLLTNTTGHVDGSWYVV